MSASSLRGRRRGRSPIRSLLTMASRLVRTDC